VLTAAEFDVAVFNQFIKVTSLVDPASRLLRPSVLWRAASANFRRPQRNNTPLPSSSSPTRAGLSIALSIELN
jgi:hypothetical protein